LRAVLACLVFLLAMGTAAGADPAAIERGLDLAGPGIRRAGVDLAEAMAILKIPSVSIAVIEGGRLGFARAYGDASPRTLYQAASMSKLVAAVAALRLVGEGRLALDAAVDGALGWRLPDSPLTAGQKVTLRRLLSMRAGGGPPGYPGYPVGAVSPDLARILDGRPPSIEPPVTIEAVPGSRYLYSGGGYEIVEVLIQQAAQEPFAAALERLVLGPAGMTDSHFAQPPPTSLAAGAARGHDSDGAMLPGGWRVMPELAAAGLWSTPTDLARLLVEVGRAWRGEAAAVLDQRLAREMLTPQEGGPYGLGASIAGPDDAPVLMKRGQNIGYQGYLLLFPATGQGIVAMTGSDNGTTLAEAIIRRAAIAYGWPALPPLGD
jgi:CubicO group peptidase (beta-lactamase class C family)